MARTKKTTSELNDHSQRAHALLSASSAHRWLACPPSAVAATAYPDTETDYAKEGTLAHEVAEAYAAGKDIKFLDEITRQMLDCGQAYADYISELKTSDNAVVLLEQRVDYSPWVPEGFGTCDCLLIQGNTLTVVDYKYGVGVPVSAVENPQMKLYALGALNDYGFAYDVTKVEMHIFQPRINNISTWSCTVDDLMAWANDTVKPTAAKAAKGKGTYTAGEHCRFCPHAGKCRKLTECCTETVKKYDLTAKVSVLAPFEIAEVLALEPLISLWLKRVKAQALDTLLSGGEITGYKAVEGRSLRDWEDEDKVSKILVSAGYSPEDIHETKLYSPAGMETALGKKKVQELLADMIVKKPGSPTVVPESDKREPINRLSEAKEDFK